MQSIESYDILRFFEELTGILMCIAAVNMLYLTFPLGILLNALKVTLLKPLKSIKS